ncbi:MAG TPA: class I SAM-dependent methyltransferase [Microvirga sp.]
MSFSAEWLALREPADHAARNRDLQGALSDHLAGREAVTVVDLGCGAGSNLRALAPHLPARQTWRLVDYDPALLDAARARIAAWAEAVEDDGATLRIRHEGRDITVAFHRADLAQDLDPALGDSPDLVTAAALFDLASAAFIARVAAAVAATRAVFYTVLTYNGAEAWTPPHPADAAVLAAFHAHQGGDKGFGPSAGPEATDALVQAFMSAGYRVRTADSPWRLLAADAPLVAALSTGIADAVRETGRVPEAELRAWLEAHRTGSACMVGHTDCLALPG